MLEKTVREALDKSRLSYEQEFRVLNYSIDFYLPDHKVGIEADGDYWHTNKRSDAIRDQKIEALGIRIVRLKEKDISKNPDLEHLILSLLNN